MGYHLAQLNIAQMRYSVDSPEMAGFIARIDEINALAANASGYVWRYEGELGNALSVRLFGAQTLVNMSVWDSVESLHNYVYRSAHVEVMRQQKKWFEHMKESHMVMWWVPEGERPTLVQAKKKLALYQAEGASTAVFGFKSAFPPPSA